jgi:pyruvyltransferase
MTVDTIKFIARTRNWGDFVSPYIYRHLSGSSPKKVPMLRASTTAHYLTVGSVLRMADDHSIVWGSGFIDENDGIGLMHWGAAHNEVLSTPREVLAVRGKLTRRKLLGFGIPCPEVYGDPALLMPRFYSPRVDRQYELGVIPHYTDLDTPLIRRLRRDPRVRIISMLKGRLGQVFELRSSYTHVVDELLACKRVVSGSLHGLVLADAYGVPSSWMEIGARAIGDGFKYHDYFSSVGRDDAGPIRLGDDSTYEDVRAAFRSPVSRVDTEALLRACPFAATPTSDPRSQPMFGAHATRVESRP